MTTSYYPVSKFAINDNVPSQNIIENDLKKDDLIMERIKEWDNYFPEDNIKFKIRKYEK